MTVNDPRISYLLRQGDTPLILAQRLCAWCGHAPELEIDLALANIGLDLLGQRATFWVMPPNWPARPAAKTAGLRPRRTPVS